MGKRGVLNPLYGMTDAKFFGQLRQDLRKRWLYSEAHKQAIKRATVAFKDGLKRVKVKCHNCGKLQNKGENILVATKKNTLKSVLAYQVDHVVECGKLNSFVDLGLFAVMLFTGEQEVMCYHCHKEKHEVQYV